MTQFKVGDRVRVKDSDNEGKGITILKAIEWGKLPEREIEWRKIE